jgi:hypothetical protein
VNVLGGGFNWHLERGWNLVSVPADPVTKGTNALFGAFDALAICFATTADPNGKVAMRNLGTNPSTYVEFTYGSPEAGEFAMGSVYGYWIYKSNAGTVDVNVVALNYSAGSNTVPLVVGWNLIGFTHNLGTTGGSSLVWTTIPTAQMYTNGVIAAFLTVGINNQKIVATWWNPTPQWYNSYVVTQTFPGMATRNWAYDTSNARAYGYWIWTGLAGTITFNVAY